MRCSRREACALLLSPALLPLAAQPRSPAGDELVWLDAATIVDRVRARAISPLEIADAYVRRIERLNPALTAYVTVTADRARRDARRLLMPPSGPTGALAAVPIAHKDLFDTAGIRTTAGSRLFDQHVPRQDATIVSRMTAAGAILLGKTNTHELGGGVTTINPFYGTTRNPWDPTRIAGGSSGGSAAAVSAGLAAAATGSDTGGSVRIPAALCGCVGFKPTFGRLSTAGLNGSAPTFDHSGLLGRTVADVALLYRAILGRDARDPTTVPAPPDPSPAAGVPARRIGVVRPFFFDTLDPDVARAVEQAIAEFRDAGHDVVDVSLPIDAGTMSRVFDPIVVAEIRARFSREWTERPDAFSPAFAAFFAFPVPSGLELAAAHRALREFQVAVGRAFETVDIVLTPTVPVTAPPIDGRIDGGLILRNTWPFNAARTPAVSIPCGVDRHDLPVGLQLAAAPFADEMLLAVAQAYQSRTTWHVRRPTL